MLIYILLTYQSQHTLSPISHPNKYLSLTNNVPTFSDCAYPIQLTDHNGILLSNSQLCANGENVTIHCTDKNVTNFKVENTNKYVMLKSDGKCLTIVRMIDRYLPMLDECNFLDSQLFVVGDGSGMCVGEEGRIGEPVIAYGDDRGVRYYEDGGMMIDCDNLDEAMREKYKDRCKVIGKGVGGNMGSNVGSNTGSNMGGSSGAGNNVGGNANINANVNANVNANLSTNLNTGVNNPNGINTSGNGTGNTTVNNASSVTAGQGNATIPITTLNASTPPQNVQPPVPLQQPSYTQLLPVQPTAMVTLSPVTTPSANRPGQIQQNRPNECVSPCVFRIEVDGRGVCICYNSANTYGNTSNINAPGSINPTGGINAPGGINPTGGINAPGSINPTGGINTPATNTTSALPASVNVSQTNGTMPTNPAQSPPFQLPISPSNTNIQSFKIPTIYLDEDTFKSLKMSTPSPSFHTQCCNTMACPCIPIINVYPIINLDVEGLFRRLKDRMKHE
ncbi:hypothetical protein THOM_1221 [Trachipleistophora hominis]|uniref:Uncharacterized protein n=1 Tax=Trachipleistophora hominis TaxID=72359 RepID=L7JWH8_TRAHO|nr:hypothetical protein THOM_1221 [Trachipleistophora hominis]